MSEDKDISKAEKPKLSPKQQLFISFYAACLNATEAARQAGYKHPRQMGAENLSKPVIRAAIDRLLKEKTIQPTEVLARLSEQATGDFSDFFDIQKYTGQPVLNLEKAAERGKLHLIKKIKFSSRTGFLESIELHDPQAALAHLGKAYALFTDKTDITSGGKPLPSWGEWVAGVLGDNTEASPDNT